MIMEGKGTSKRYNDMVNVKGEVAIPMFVELNCAYIGI